MVLPLEESKQASQETGSEAAPVSGHQMPGSDQDFRMVHWRLDTEQWGSWKNSTISQDSSQLATQSTSTVRVKIINLAIIRMMANPSHQGTGGSGKGSGRRKGSENLG